MQAIHADCWVHGRQLPFDAAADALTDEEEEVLKHVGLPVRLDWPPFEASPVTDWLVAREIAGSTLIRLGTDLGTVIGIDAGRRTIQSVDPAGGLPRRFVNSSLFLFVFSLCQAKRFREDLAVKPEVEQAREVGATVADLARVDPHAFEDADNYWAVFWEQVRDGLL